MTADTQQISKAVVNARFLKGDRGEWFGRPGERRFRKRATVRATRRLGEAVVRGAAFG